MNKKFMLSVVVLMFVLTLTLVGCNTNNNNDEFNSDASIKVYTRDTTSGTRDGFFSKIDFEDAVKDNSALAEGYSQVESNGSMVNAVKTDEYGIGYISLASLDSSGCKALIYNGIMPSVENVNNSTYALTRNFNYLTRAEGTYSSSDKEAIVTAFVAYLETKDAKTIIQNNDGILSMESSDPTWEDIKDLYPISSKDNSDVTVRFGGSTSVEKIAKALSSDFSSKCGNFVAEHEHTGSGDAYKRTQGAQKAESVALDIGFASREFKLTDSEPALDTTYGKICTDAIVAVVNTENPLTNVDTQTLVDIYNGTITIWSEVQE